MLNHDIICYRSFLGGIFYLGTVLIGGFLDVPFWRVLYKSSFGYLLLLLC